MKLEREAAAGWSRSAAAAAAAPSWGTSAPAYIPCRGEEELSVSV